MIMAERVLVECGMCETVYALMIDPDDLKRWRKGELIQTAMPYLSADQRELLISGTCGKCFDKMFEGE